MRHPFAGINIPQSTDPQTAHHSTQLRPTRRAVVQGMLGGLSLAALPWEAAADERAKPEDQAQPPVTRDRYLVVPADYRKFTAMRRKELNVLGNFFNPAVQSRDQRRTQGGFLAWLTPQEAEALRAEPDVAGVKRVLPEDIPSPQESARKGDQHVLIRLLPGDWKIKPKAGTYQTAAEILETWQKAFEGHDGLAVLEGPQESMLVLQVGPQELPKDVLAAIKEHPQVVSLQWMAAPAQRPSGGVTTDALGEEGAATTLALNEEGGPVPSTRALGEEGALPPPTTEALGEEGRPRPPRPRPGGVTTFALGEEGR